jgi:hypothetical protein
LEFSFLQLSPESVLSLSHVDKVTVADPGIVKLSPHPMLDPFPP